MTRRFATWLVAVLLLGPQAPALAQTTITWLCGLSDELTRLSCVADQDEALADASVSAAQAATATTGEVRGTRFPLDPARVWSVPLWTVPYDMASVRALAQATICYRSLACEVVMLPPAGPRPLLQPGRLVQARPTR